MSRFDEFVLVRQAILLTIDTFGFSHIVPVFGLPFLLLTAGDEPKRFLFARLSVVSLNLARSLFLLLLHLVFPFLAINRCLSWQVYMIYGFITAATTTATLLCVTIQRRHLMVFQHNYLPPQILHSFFLQLDHCYSKIWLLHLSGLGTFRPKICVRRGGSHADGCADMPGFDVLSQSNRRQSGAWLQEKGSEKEMSIYSIHFVNFWTKFLIRSTDDTMHGKGWIFYLDHFGQEFCRMKISLFLNYDLMLNSNSPFLACWFIISTNS